MLGLVVLLGIGLSKVADRPYADVSLPAPSAREPSPRDEENELAAAFLSSHAGDVDDSFDCNVAGLSHENPDGSSRIRVLAKVSMGDVLVLAREPDNVVDKNAVAIFAANGEKLGFVPARHAARLAKEMDGGKVWLALMLGRWKPRGRKAVIIARVLLFRVTEAGMDRMATAQAAGNSSA